MSRDPVRVRAALTAIIVLSAAAACQTRFNVDGARALARVERQVRAGPRVPGTPAHDSIRVWIGVLGGTRKTKSTETPFVASHLAEEL